PLSDVRPLSSTSFPYTTLFRSAMTERQGGSDLRANSSRAVPLDGGEYELSGNKWFCSAPMSDAFFTLARTEAGLTCFFVPRSLADRKSTRLNSSHGSISYAVFC